MKVVVLGSSSKGNSTYVESGNTKFLIDVGLGFNDIKDKLFKLGVYPDEINFIVITHAHIDHVKSLHSFSRVYNTKIFIGKNTYNEYLKKDYIHNYTFIEDVNDFDGIKIDKIPISHDKSGYGFVFYLEDKTLAYITDTGMIHSKYHNILSNRDIYLFESNHDVEMEMNGTKDEMTKIRNIGDEGHLSNEQCAMYLNHFLGDNTKVIMLMHISEHDNTYELAFKVNREAIDEKIEVHISNASIMSDIIEL